MNSRLLSIDALRGFAALWVASYHLWNVFAPGCSAQTEPLPINANTEPFILATFPFFGYGYVGVVLFFVISGFCIHLPQARRFHKRGDDELAPREFLRRRFWRLYPAYIGSLLLATVGLAAMTLSSAAVTGYNWEVLAEASGLRSYLLLNASLLLAINPKSVLTNPVAWTLVYEVQFYLCYPLLLKLCRRIGFAPVAGILLSIELVFLLTPTPGVLKPLHPYFEWFFLRRDSEWFLGMWLAERFAAGRVLSRRMAGVVLLAGAGGGVLASVFPATWVIHEPLLAVASLGLLAWVIAPAEQTKVGKHVTTCFAWFGDFSYSIYLVHMPVYRIVFAGATLIPGRTFATDLITGLIAFGVMIAVARGLFLLLERPFMPTPSRVPNPVTAVAT